MNTSTSSTSLALLLIIPSLSLNCPLGKAWEVAANASLPADLSPPWPERGFLSRFGSLPFSPTPTFFDCRQILLGISWQFPCLSHRHELHPARHVCSSSSGQCSASRAAAAQSTELLPSGRSYCPRGAVSDVLFALRQTVTCTQDLAGERPV